MNPKARALFLAGVVLASAIAAGWFFVERPAAETRIEETASERSHEAATPVPLASKPSPPKVAGTPSRSAQDTEPVPATPPPIVVTSGPLEWEQRAARAAETQRDATGRSKALLALLPGLPEEALANVAEQAVDQLPDAGYAGTALPVVTNHATHGQVLSVLFADLMERPDAIALPALLQIARDPEHPFAPSARDNLKLLLRADHGSDWPAWERDVQRRLSEKR